MRPLVLGLEVGAADTVAAPPVVDKERGDAWTISRRREWMARALEDTLYAGRRVAVTYPVDAPVSGATFSTSRHVLYWRDRAPTVATPPYLIPSQLALHLVTRWSVERLYLEGEDRIWHMLPMSPGGPGTGRIDKHRV